MTSGEGAFDGADGEEHGRQCGPGVRLALDRVDRDEPVLRVEAHCVGLGIDDDTNAPVVPKLVLPRKLLEEAIEVSVARTK